MQTIKTVIKKEFDADGKLLKHTEKTIIKETLDNAPVRPVTYPITYPVYPHQPIDLQPWVTYTNGTGYTVLDPTESKEPIVFNTPRVVFK